MDTFILMLKGVLHDDKASVDTFTPNLNLLHGVLEQDPSSTSNQSFASSLFPHIFLLAFLLPQVRSVDANQQAIAKGLWEKWMDNASEEAKGTTLSAVKNLLRELLSDTSGHPTYVHFSTISLCTR